MVCEEESRGRIVEEEKTKFEVEGIVGKFFFAFQLPAPCSMPLATLLDLLPPVFNSFPQ